MSVCARSLSAPLKAVLATQCIPLEEGCSWAFLYLDDRLGGQSDLPVGVAMVTSGSQAAGALADFARGAHPVGTILGLPDGDYSFRGHAFDSNHFLLFTPLLLYQAE
jgi:hypothetical protein